MLNIIIRNAVDLPIYEQIFLQIKECILRGDVKEGELLPSIRALAKDLRISVITTKRAYDELEREGFIHTVAGKGTFVAEKNADLLREEHLKEIEGHMRTILSLSRPLELEKEELLEMFRLIYEEEL